MKFILTNDIQTYLYKIAKARHDAKHFSFRESGHLTTENNRLDFTKVFKIESKYMPHFLGLVGEFAWSLKTGEPLDETIYKIKDSGEDFKGVEVKTITYSGEGEPELKIKVSEYEDKKPKKYVLVHFNLKTKEVSILGTITRKTFDKHKVKKRYGRFLPDNYVVPVSKMTKVK